MMITIYIGGVGMNLASVTHTVHYDRCYNPAWQAQAPDRAHRLGQHSTVLVHNLVTKGTFALLSAKSNQKGKGHSYLSRTAWQSCASSWTSWTRSSSYVRLHILVQARQVRPFLVLGSRGAPEHIRGRIHKGPPQRSLVRLECVQQGERVHRRIFRA